MIKHSNIVGYYPAYFLFPTGCVCEIYLKGLKSGGVINTLLFNRSNTEKIFFYEECDSRQFFGAYIVIYMSCDHNANNDSY